jgi:hypothetical protein
LFELQISGTLLLYHSPDGSIIRSTSSTVSVGFTDGARHWVRVTRSASTGDVKFYTSTDGQAWTQLGATVSTTVEGLFDGTAQVQIGAFGGSGDSFGPGKIYYAELRNGIDGTVVTKFDPRRFSSTNLTADMLTGEIWTVNQSGSPSATIVHLPEGVIADPYPLRRGRFDVAPIARDGETMTIRARYEDRLIDLERPRERRYTREDQQLRLAGDKGFDQVPELQDVQDVWG